MTYRTPTTGEEVAAIVVIDNEIAFWNDVEDHIAFNVRNPLTYNPLIDFREDLHTFPSKSTSWVPDEYDINRYLERCWSCQLTVVSADDDFGLCVDCHEEKCGEDQHETEAEEAGRRSSVPVLLDELSGRYAYDVGRLGW